MPKPPDRVQLQKYETAASGGDAADEAAAEGFNTPLDADEDAPDVAGIYYQESPAVRDKTVTTYREGGQLYLEDALNSGINRKSLAQLSSGALPPATAIGQMVISTDGALLTVQAIAVSDLGEIAVDDNGIIGVVG